MAELKRKVTHSSLLHSTLNPPRPPTPPTLFHPPPPLPTPHPPTRPGDRPRVLCQGAKGGGGAETEGGSTPLNLPLLPPTPRTLPLAHPLTALYVRNAQATALEFSAKKREAAERELKRKAAEAEAEAAVARKEKGAAV